MDTTYFVEIDEFVCPAEFWPALGYDGDARYVAIYWEQCGDEASWADGRRAFCGAHWPSYLALLKHNFSPGHPYHWLLGSSDAEAVFWLVVDREEGRAWLAPTEPAESGLRSQWSWPEAVDVATDGCGVVLDFAFEELSFEELSFDDGSAREQIVQDAANYEALLLALAARPAKWMRVRQQIDDYAARWQTEA